MDSLSIAGSESTNATGADRVTVLNSALKLEISQFKSATADPEGRTFTWGALVEILTRAPHVRASKQACQLLNFATFGDERTKKKNGKLGLLRNNANVQRLFGVIGDYDAEQVSIAEAAERLEQANIEAFLHTTPSHKPDAPRWRAMAPLSQPVSPTEYAALVDKLNGALGGILGAESWDVSRCYYVGRVQGVEYETRRVTGKCIDLADEITPIGKAGRKATEPAATPREPVEPTEPDDELIEDLRTVLRDARYQKAVKPNRTAENYNRWNEANLALLSLGEAGEALIREYSVDGADEWLERNRDTVPRCDYRHVFTMAEELGIPNPRGRRTVAADPGDFPADAVPIGDVPAAQHLNTDQANAVRIRKAFGEKLIAANSRFHWWTGTHWAFDEGEAHRCAGRLSAIVRAEARRVRKRVEAKRAEIGELIQAALDHPRKHPLGSTPEGAEYERLLSQAETLEKWSVRCEMKPAQDAALGLLRKQLTIPAEALDADPWALNCLNGTIDLRTGELREHNPADYITRIAPVEYDPNASAPRFERFLDEITDGNRPLAAFLQRWFGYCATGDVREQKFVIHIGQGANGKGTLLELVASVLGDYAGAAPPSLLTSSGRGERHPTEIADLLGKRMVTAHETDDGAVLREGFVKQLTGNDRLKARYMRGDFFEFAPTHKVQLLTNHKPQIKGQDFAIWRRVLLVPYPVKFGSVGEVESGKATAPRDDALPEALAAERAGVLRWIVEGTVEWHRGGLRPPDCVLAAGLEYQSEQDRVGQFVNECCELDREAWTPINGSGFDSAVFPAYVQWCREAGYQHLGRGRFMDELERCVPFFRRESRKVEGEAGRRRSCSGVVGIRVLEE
ncbi:MAG TPA: phage/plasmid primase, P4 family [Gammaproteobacteria bacterium]